MVDIRQSAAYAEYIEKIGWRVEKIGKINIFIRPFWRIAKIQRVNIPTNFPKITGVWMTKIEPLNTPPKTFKQDSWPLLASKTLRVDLSKTNFKKDCRYALKRLENKNWKIEKNNFDKFYEIWKKAAGIKKLWIPNKKDYEALINAFKDKCFCITINDLSGAVMLMHDKMAYYYYSACLSEGKKLNLPYLVVWECMQEAKKWGCKLWDFEGIYDERWPNKGWKGFTHFKKSFGGEEVEFPGSFTRWF